MKETVILVALREGLQANGTFISLDVLKASLPQFEHLPNVLRAWIDENQSPACIFVEVVKPRCITSKISRISVSFTATWQPSHWFDNGNEEANEHEFAKSIGKNINSKVVCMNVEKIENVRVLGYK